MPECGSERLRPPVKARAVPAESFAELLRLAVHDADAASGLALAYAAFPPDGRRALVDAVLADGKTGTAGLSAVLASFLGVERDAGVARHICCAISALAGNGLQGAVPARAALAGDEALGALRLARPLFGEWAETLELWWERERGITRAVFEPMAANACLTRDRGAEPGDLPFTEVPLCRAIDRATAVLWEHRKRIGPLPAAVRPFADLFSLPVDPAG